MGPHGPKHSHDLDEYIGCVLEPLELLVHCLIDFYINKNYVATGASPGFAYESVLKLILKWLYLQVHFCSNFNTNSYANLSTNGSGAPGPFLYQFQFKFISKSVQKGLWSSRSISVSISIQTSTQICPPMALELQVHFCINFNTKFPAKSVKRKAIDQNYF